MSVTLTICVMLCCSNSSRSSAIVLPDKNKIPFAAWDDLDKIEMDFTTEQVLAEKETFDILAERGYEVLLDDLE